jgi:hypothetical protein
MTKAPVLLLQGRQDAPAANFRIILGEPPLAGGGPTPSGPGLSGVSGNTSCRQPSE